MTNALPQQQTLPALDVTAVRARLVDLLDKYAGDVARAESGAEVNELVHGYATACLRELDGVEGSEAESLRAVYRDMQVRSSTEGEPGCRATS